ncbi:MAG: AMMECR1 family protein [Myxococcales bacterium]|nr:AMMECR1 family protein [Myxococcales bacterium]
MMARLLLVLAFLSASRAASASEPGFLTTARVIVARHGSDLMALARRTLDDAVLRGELDPTVEAPGTPAPFGVFVTLVKDKETRGCFGSMEPGGKSLEALVIEGAVGAARLDPRVRPLSSAELQTVQIILSFVGPTVPVLTMGELDPKRHGLMVRAGERRSVLLPGEAKTASWSLRRNLRQAGIRRREPYEMFRFRTVTIYE